MAQNLEAEVDIQGRYYSETAAEYNDMHVREHDQHAFALNVMLGMTDYFQIRSILDVGSGTGRAIAEIKRRRPDLVIRGVEPVKELREMAYAQGISPDELTYGDALGLEFPDHEFDMVCEFGVLHHLRYPASAIDEMLRVAKKAIFISDNNNFGQGSALSRNLKHIIKVAGLWPLAVYLKTRGRGYHYSEGDGLAYDYSVFDSYRQIEQQCESVHMINTQAAGPNHYRTASHVALLGIK